MSADGPAPVGEIARLRVRFPLLDRESAFAADRALAERLIARQGALHGAYRTADHGIELASSDPASALHLAIDLQRLLLQLPWSPALLAHPEGKADGARWRGPRAAMALHVDTPTPRADLKVGRTRYLGPGTAELVALHALARPGEVLLSASAWERLRSALGSDLVPVLVGHLAGSGAPVVSVLPAELAGRALGRSDLPPPDPQDEAAFARAGLQRATADWAAAQRSGDA